MIVQNRKITLKDVAMRAGVSSAVVSHVLNGMKSGSIRVGACKRDEIIKASQELGYIPHFNARQMVKRRSFTIGAVLIMHPESTPPDTVSVLYSYSYESLLGIEAVCSQKNYNCLIHVHRLDTDFKLPRMMCDGSVDGVIIIGPSTPQLLAHFAKAKITCVQLGSNVPRDMGVKFVAADLVTKFKQVSEALFRQHGQCRQMVCLPEGPGPDEIARHFVAMNEQIPQLHNEAMVIPAIWPQEHAKDIFRGLLMRPDRPRTIFIEPVQTGPLLSVARELNISIPDDLDILTYGVRSVHDKLSFYHSLSFSMITFDIEEVARLAARLLIKTFGDSQEDVPNSTECGFVNGQTCRMLQL